MRTCMDPGMADLFKREETIEGATLVCSGDLMPVCQKSPKEKDHRSWMGSCRYVLDGNRDWIGRRGETPEHYCAMRYVVGNGT